jgi:hypothetical protein
MFVYFVILFTKTIINGFAHFVYFFYSYLDRNFIADSKNIQKFHIICKMSFLEKKFLLNFYLVEQQALPI